MNNIDLTKELSQNFIDFSHEANCQRAFADARDGLKPGQRACLWEMFVKGYSSSKPHVKSAKISGGTIATWWPHGDTAIYDTFARMSQTWINNIPEVDWHGANGSIQISGEPAASRYTEARLSKATEEGMLYNIKKHNVPMKLNFTEDEEWPEVFPALIPRLMVNGCQGIGSTIANVWLPHSLDDLSKIIEEYVKTGEIDYNNIAPSFPTGGTIINKSDLPTIYKTGKGKAILRGTAEIKGNSILITEIPYQVYVEPFIDQIKELIIKDELKGISNVLNKSDKKRLLIEVECESNPQGVLQKLYALTSLQKSFSANQIALVGKTPKLLTLKEYLDIYLQHNYECIKREYSYDLTKTKDRLEIVEGLIRALEDIDNIIALIKASQSSSDAVVKLIERYNFTERQAKAIVDMKLGRLAHLEKVELNEEKIGLLSTIETCNEVISNVEKQKEIYLDRFLKVSKKYGDARRTQLMDIEIPKDKKEKEVAEVVPEDVVVVTNQAGYIKRIPVASFKVQRRGTKGIKTADETILDVVKTNTVDTMMFFTDKGRMYRCLVDKIIEGDNTSKGMHISDLVKLETTTERIIAVSSLHRKTTPKYIYFITKKGLIKKSLLSEYTQSTRNTGLQAIKLGAGDSIANIIFMDDEDVVVVTKKGMGIKFDTKTINAIGRLTTGVKAIKLEEGDEVIAGLPVHKETDCLALVAEAGIGKKLALTELPRQTKGGKGIILYKDQVVAGAAMVSDEDNILIIGRSTVTISAKDIPQYSKTADGVILIKSKVKQIVKL